MRYKYYITLHQYNVKFTHVTRVDIVVVSTTSFPTGFLCTKPSAFICLRLVFAQTWGHSKK